MLCTNSSRVLNILVSKSSERSEVVSDRRERAKTSFVTGPSWPNFLVLKPKYFGPKLSFGIARSLRSLTTRFARWFQNQKVGWRGSERETCRRRFCLFAFGTARSLSRVRSAHVIQVNNTSKPRHIHSKLHSQFHVLDHRLPRVKYFLTNSPPPYL